LGPVTLQDIPNNFACQKFFDGFIYN